LIIWRAERGEYLTPAGGGEYLAPAGGGEYLAAREKHSICRLRGGEYWIQARRGVSGCWKKVSIGSRQGDEYMVARREWEEVVMGPAGGKKPLPTY